jgi:hypothetical protein
MSALLVRSALEVALAAMTPSLATAFENAPFAAVAATVAYQRVTVLLAEPANPVVGPGFHTEQGFMQVDLAYPLNAGPGVATARAELIRSTFYRGASFTASGVTVNIERTPEIMPGRVEEDRFIVPVRIRFYAHIGG